MAFRRLFGWNRPLISDLSDATPEHLLHAAEDAVRDARLLEVRKLEVLLAWADLHSGDNTGHLGPLTRVEGRHINGPRLLAQVRELLARHTNVTVTPVIDLHTGRSVNGYEHPTDVKHRTEPRTLGDAFPHATGLFKRSGRSPDHDHTTPYDKHGPPGQTGDHNDTPLTRHHHRAKTHLGHTVLQLGPDRWAWGTPHGLHRLVTTLGTTTITRAEDQLLEQHALVLADDYAA